METTETFLLTIETVPKLLTIKSADLATEESRSRLDAIAEIAPTILISTTELDKLPPGLRAELEDLAISFKRGKFPVEDLEKRTLHLAPDLPLTDPQGKLSLLPVDSEEDTPTLVYFTKFNIPDESDCEDIFYIDGGDEFPGHPPSLAVRCLRIGQTGNGNDMPKNSSS